MSDFLSHLVARSTTPTLAIQPRVASLFEPASNAPAPFIEPFEPESIDSPSSEVAFEQQSMPAIQRQEQSSEPSYEARQEQQPLMQQERSSIFSLERTRLDSSEPVHSVSLAEVTETPPPPRSIAAVPFSEPSPHLEPAVQSVLESETPRFSQPAPAQTAAPVKLEIQEIVTERLIAAPTSFEFQGRAAPKTPAVSSFNAVSVPPVIQSMRLNVESRVERSASPEITPLADLAEPAGRSIASTVTPSITPAATIAPIAPRAIAPAIQLAPPSRHDTAPDVTPTIQVTIGRIEVRATPPAAAAPRARPSTPAMSLEDYLRQRGGNR